MIRRLTRIPSTPVQLRNLPLNAYRTHLYPNQPHLVEQYAMAPHLPGPPAYLPHTSAWSSPAGGLNAVASAQHNLVQLQAAALTRVASGLAVTQEHLDAIATAALPYTAVKMQLQLQPTQTNLMPRLSRPTYQGMPTFLRKFRRVANHPWSFVNSDGSTAFPTIGTSIMSGAVRIMNALKNGRG